MWEERKRSDHLARIKTPYFASGNTCAYARVVNFENALFLPLFLMSTFRGECHASAVFVTACLSFPVKLSARVIFTIT